MTTLAVTLVTVFIVSFLIFALLVAWSSERTKRVISELKQEQSSELQKINQQADENLQSKLDSVHTIIGDSVNPDDPWRGLRAEERSDHPPELRVEESATSDPRSVGQFTQAVSGMRTNKRSENVEDDGTGLPSRQKETP